VSIYADSHGSATFSGTVQNQLALALHSFQIPLRAEPRRNLVVCFVVKEGVSLLDNFFSNRQTPDRGPGFAGI
jgi:hypothetical protein